MVEVHNKSVGEDRMEDDAISFVIVSHPNSLERSENEPVLVREDVLESALHTLSLHSRPLSANACMSATTLSSLSSLDPEGKDRLLEHLMQENLSFKETIHQNNLRMKQQLAALMSLAKCDQVFQEHKERFKETRNLVMRLQSEKIELQRKCQSMSEIGHGIISDSDKTELAALKLNYESEVLKNNAMLLELKTLREENVHMSKEISAIKAQDNLNKEALQQAMQAQLGTEKECAYFKVISDSVGAELAALNFKYKAEVEENKTALLELNTLREENVRLKKEINDSISEKAVCQLYDLSAQVVEASRQSAKEVDSMVAKMEESQQNLLEKEAVAQRLQSQIDDMTAVIAKLTEKLEHLKTELQTTLQRNSELTLENESIPVLKEQAKVYESDFLLERGERERLSGELFQLKRDFEALHKHLQQSQETNADDNSSLTLEAPDPRFLCPKCNKAFQTLPPLELHVEHCLQL